MPEIVFSSGSCGGFGFLFSEKSKLAQPVAVAASSNNDGIPSLFISFVFKGRYYPFCGGISRRFRVVGRLIFWRGGFLSV